ncbi:fumble-domain-containing protein [Polychaeton citri CBS 116435]|uniref:Fumble-domain-containing protein n=1 Tax=Polychaeton citri CBS 116435 TaxID=1314669 RepID=A0A9P4Q4E5_9PEZI|nr:fumble-domain-containing protein [Polychaeton citri CBS 116435]
MERPVSKRRRISSSASDMRSTIEQPGSIKINSSGAHIVDHEDSSEDSPPASEYGSSHSQDERLEQSYQHHKRDIRLPNHNSVVSHVAADIGGSLAKVVYFSREEGRAESGGRLEFLSFETDKIDDCIEYLRQLQSKHEQQTNGDFKAEPALSVMATGGGAYKFYDRIKRRLGVDVVREDEMECLINGLDFFITEIPMEVFTYHDEDQDNAMQFETSPRSRDNIYPYLLVNIGSGVSMIKVSGPSQFSRIGGTSLGGGTLWGLLSLLTGARSFDDMLAMADKGDNGAVDLLVGDIYGSGTGYEKIGLGERAIASSFGKVLKRKRKAEREAEDGNGMTNGDPAHDLEKGREGGERDGAALVGDGRMFKPEDISRSLLYAISNNIGQIAYLQSEKHNLQRIYFGGSFIRGHRQTIHTLSYAIKFWSKGAKQAYFVRHEGYLGAVGAFLKRKPANWGRRGSVDFIDV